MHARVYTRVSIHASTHSHTYTPPRAVALTYACPGMGMGGMAPVQLDSTVKPKGRRSTGSLDLLAKLLKASNTLEGMY